MKQFIVDRHTTPSTPSMDEVPNEKIPIYDNLADVESDLANLEAGQIVATKDTGDELSQPVDVVEEGNLHAVSSNAVADIFSANIDNTKFALSTTANVEVTAQYTGLLYVVIRQENTNRSAIFENGTELIADDNYSEGSYYRTFTVLIRKGRKYKWMGNSGIMYLQNFIPFNLS